MPNAIRFPDGFENTLNILDELQAEAEAAQAPAPQQEQTWPNIEDETQGDPPAIIVEDTPSDTRERVLEALKMSLAWADRIEDQEFAKRMRDKLARSNVHGSRVEGIFDHRDVARLLGSVQNWTPVVSSKGPSIQVFQGTLPAGFEDKAYAAYATIRQLFAKFGLPGLSTIQAKQGYQRPDEFYLCTTIRFPTDIITVQLKNEQTGLHIETMQQWFAGPELSSLIRNDDGDTLVRCGVQIPQVYEQQRQFQPRPGPRKPFHRGPGGYGGVNNS